jgi:programmed cell death protein 5
VKPEKAGWVEDMLIQMAQGGQIRGKVSEKELIDLLSQVAAETGKKSTTITMARRSALEDSDEEDWS